MSWNFEQEQKIIDGFVNDFEQECDALEKELDQELALEEANSNKLINDLPVIGMKLYWGYFVLASSEEASKVISFLKERKVWTTPLPEINYEGWRMDFGSATSRDVEDVKKEFNVVDDMAIEETDGPHDKIN